MIPKMEWFYTAPVEAFAVRRGDPLGMRAVADDMAEWLVPGLSNRTLDARWISIMCWAVGRGHAAWRAFHSVQDDSAALSREATNELYAWVRPLEILWVARAIAATDAQGADQRRQLPGVQAARRWLRNPKAESFGFTRDAYERYRFTGVYGGYRIALRNLPGLTIGGDGWRLDNLGKQLAEVVQAHVQYVQVGRPRPGARPQPERYWVKQFAWRDDTTTYLPTPASAPGRLVGAERKILKSILFSSDHGHEQGAHRQAVLEAAAAIQAKTRSELFSRLARKLGQAGPTSALGLMSAFSELTDAGIAAMNACWDAVIDGSNSGQAFASFDDVVERKPMVDALVALETAAQRWQRETKLASTYRVADALAGRVIGVRGRRRQIEALVQHHHLFGGGLKWLAIDGKTIKRLVPPNSGHASAYRYRLSALSRLGVQCGVIDEVHPTLLASDEFDAMEDA